MKDLRKFIATTIREYLNENTTTPHYSVDKDIKNSGFGEEIYKIKMFINDNEIGVLVLRIFLEKNKAEIMRVDIIDEYKGKGFGKQLYFKAKEIANNHNSNLYGGEIQTNDAKQVWNSFIRNGMTKTDSDGNFYI